MLKTPEIANLPPVHEDGSPAVAPQLCAPPARAANQPVVQVSPAGSIKRRAVAGHGIAAELVCSTGHDTIECRYRGTADLLVAYERCTRLDGETAIEGAPRSRLRDLARKLTFVPAGHEYFEWHRPRAAMRVMFLYLDAPGRDAAEDARSAQAMEIRRTPRVLFDDEMVWATVLKLKELMEGGFSSAAYLEALGVVLSQELLRPRRARDGADASAKGGLAAWQQRAVTAFIEEHLAEQIPLATLARLVRLSPYHFSRAFKQSFGLPPHRYHTKRRIERAKALLQARELSVTDIGLALGFSETSSFTAAFRKSTGLTPSRYHRSIG